MFNRNSTTGVFNFTTATESDLPILKEKEFPDMWDEMYKKTIDKIWELISDYNKTSLKNPQENVMKPHVFNRNITVMHTDKAFEESTDIAANIHKVKNSTTANDFINIQSIQKSIFKNTPLEFNGIPAKLEDTKDSII
jgi:hypothetical protein